MTSLPSYAERIWVFHTRRFVVRYKGGVAEVCRKHGNLEQRIGSAAGGYTWRDTVRMALEHATDTLIVNALHGNKR